MGPSKKVIERVAEAENTEPTELDLPLFETVDPDALDSLFDSVEGGPTRDRGQVRFEYCGYTVTVTAEDSVKLRQRD